MEETLIKKLFIKNIKILHPGVSINLRNFRSRLVETKPFNTISTILKT